MLNKKENASDTDDANLDSWTFLELPITTNAVLRLLTENPEFLNQIERRNHNGRSLIQTFYSYYQSSLSSLSSFSALSSSFKKDKEDQPSQKQLVANLISTNEVMEASARVLMMLTQMLSEPEAKKFEFKNSHGLYLLSSSKKRHLEDDLFISIDLVEKKYQRGLLNLMYNVKLIVLPVDTVNYDHVGRIYKDSDLPENYKTAGGYTDSLEHSSSNYSYLGGVTHGQDIDKNKHIDSQRAALLTQCIMDPLVNVIDRQFQRSS